MAKVFIERVVSLCESYLPTVRIQEVKALVRKPTKYNTGFETLYKRVDEALGFWTHQPTRVMEYKIIIKQEHRWGIHIAQETEQSQILKTIRKILYIHKIANLDSNSISVGTMDFLWGINLEGKEEIVLKVTKDYNLEIEYNVVEREYEVTFYPYTAKPSQPLKTNII